MTLLAGRYLLTEVVGSGGMADVHRATDQVLGREVAVKVLHTSADAAARARFAGEARTVAALNHPGLVGVLDAGVENGEPYLVMELIDGPTLGGRLADGGPMGADEVASLGAELADALACAHQNGVVHRDVKPGNILLRNDGTAVLTDFGIARLLGDTAQHTSVGDVIGSPAYLSPEQVNGLPVTGAVDVYALGLVMLEAFTGVRAYPGPPIEAAIARLTTPPALPVSMPRELRDLVLRMTALDPVDRPTASEVAATLSADQTQADRTQVVPAGYLQEAAATSAPGLSAVTSRFRDRGALLPAAAVLAVVLALGFGALQLRAEDARTGPPPSVPSTSSDAKPVSNPSTPRPTVRPVSAPKKKPGATKGRQGKHCHGNGRHACSDESDESD